jgi:hypothetical protein
VVDARSSCGDELWLGVKCHTEPGLQNHIDIVGTVSDGYRVRFRQAKRMARSVIAATWPFRPT